MDQLTTSIISRTEICENIHLLELEAPQISSASRPGQFITIRCSEEVLLRRPFSIHRLHDDHINILFTISGPGTQWLASRNSGEMLDILGPLGNGFEIHSETRNLLLVAGGMGIAPLVYLAENAVADGLSVKLLAGARTRSQLYPESLEKVEIMHVTEDGSAGEKGMITDLLPPLVTWADQICACGPRPMYRTMAEMPDVLQGKSIQISVERVMACGVGACRGCAITTTSGIQMVCSEGPVFELNQIIWQR